MESGHRTGIRSPSQADNRVIYRKPANGTGEGRATPRRRHQQSSLGLVARWEIDCVRGYRHHDRQRFVAIALDGDHKPVPYLQTPFNEGDAQFSPDGRWMAYASNESGQPQVYVQAIPASGAKWQISPAGGAQPRWRRDGKELFYISTDQKLMAVSVKSGRRQCRPGLRRYQQSRIPRTARVQEAAPFLSTESTFMASGFPSGMRC